MMEDERALQALLDPLVPEEETVCEWDDVLSRVEQIIKDDLPQRPVSRRGFASRRPRRAVRRLTVAFAGAAGLAVLVFAAVAFWPTSSGGNTLPVQRALAAVGTGEVLHVVTEQPSPPGWYQRVCAPERHADRDRAAAGGACVRPEPRPEEDGHDSERDRL